MGAGHEHTCSTLAAIDNLLEAAVQLGEEKAEELEAKLLKHKMENENISLGEEFYICTGGNPLKISAGVPANKRKRDEFNSLSMETIQELSVQIELSDNNAKQLCSTMCWI